MYYTKKKNLKKLAAFMQEELTRRVEKNEDPTRRNTYGISCEVKKQECDEVKWYILILGLDGSVNMTVKQSHDGIRVVAFIILMNTKT